MIVQTKPASSPAMGQEILLLERSTMVGNIIVSTARQLGLRPVRLVTNCRSAQQFLEHHPFDGVITSLEEEEETLQLLQALREGAFKSMANTPVAITTTQCDAVLALRIKELHVRRILLKPFKIRDLITTIEMLTQPAV